MTHHPQVRIEHDGVSADADEGIAPLVLALWERGYRTVGSCQNQDDLDVAWIGFESMEQAKDFQQVCDGHLIEPNDEDRETAEAHGANTWRNGEVGVSFPAWEIPLVLRALESGGRVLHKEEPQSARNEPREVGRNDPCPCGSGKKYKRCHGD